MRISRTQTMLLQLSLDRNSRGSIASLVQMGVCTYGQGRQVIRLEKLEKVYETAKLEEFSRFRRDDSCFFQDYCLPWRISQGGQELKNHE